MYIVGVDPGRDKCGVALLHIKGERIRQKVVPTREVTECIRRWSNEYSPITIVIGDRTGFQSLRDELEHIDWKYRVKSIVSIDEHLTTLEARREYFSENRPKGIKRLIPLSMQLPPVAYDDYAAVILAERFIAKQKEDR